MNILSIFLIYFIIWWLVFLPTLSMGHQLEENPEKGHDIGAPKNPRMGYKFLLTSAITAGITVAIVLGAYLLGIKL